jgi:hypothetical protein
MPDPQRYVVHEAILRKRGRGSVWRLKLLPLPDPVDPREGGEIVVEVPPSLIDEMEFGMPYTRDELTAFEEP